MFILRWHSLYLATGIMPLGRHERRGSEIRADIWPGQMSSPKVAMFITDLHQSQGGVRRRQDAQSSSSTRRYPCSRCWEMLTPARTGPVRKEDQAITDNSQADYMHSPINDVGELLRNQWACRASGLTYFPSEVQSRIQQSSLGADIIVWRTTSWVMC